MVLGFGACKKLSSMLIASFSYSSQALAKGKWSLIVFLPDHWHGLSASTSVAFVRFLKK